ncbi:uncharacterized protein PAC_18375 [Phialocephala subalpina]|uniref:PH domain-containing protein n=1 Tax=Phialocephala subalpina TaxID=576137 RepID=A0A1L7XTW4_9HELO|nr:uncharacterized protein PAC_18375 [Phialocephala subalpina]
MVQEESSGSHVAASGAISSARRQSIDTSRQSSARHSMDEYYQREGISEPPEPPPNYDALLESPTLRRRFNIQPREDEGREVLPQYSCEISVQSVFLKKMELEGAVHKAQDRNWYKVLATLQGTALSFYKYQKPGMFSSARDASGKKTGPDFPPGLKRGQFLRSYNLQHADVGIAADYLKKRYVIRVRAEADQFLLSCHKIETFVLWLQSLFAAIDLAPPLDDREIPRDLSIPRRTRRRVARAGFSDAPANTALVQEQEEIISTQFPSLTVAETQASGSGAEVSRPATIADQDDMIEELESISSSPAISRPASPPSASPSTTDSSPTTTSSSLPSTTPSTPNPTSTSTNPPPRSSLLSRARHAMSSSPYLSSTTPNAPNPNITSDGKWRPQHQWTHFYDMMYAKRCMAVLTHRSPRKSNFVVMKGKRWVVDWATGKLEREGPPDYGEVVGAERVERSQRSMAGRIGGKAGDQEGVMVVQREVRV